MFPAKKGIIIGDWKIENRADLLSSVNRAVLKGKPMN
jgi:hypothetical protein